MKPGAKTAFHPATDTASGARLRRERRREKSWAMVRQHYHDRGWQHANSHYKRLLAEVITPGAVVLDVGCGRCFPMASHLLACGAEVHGIDPVAEPREAPSGVTCLRATAERIPYPEGSFDVVASSSVLEHLEDPLSAFREFRRVLKTGGRVVFLAPNRYDYVSLIAAAVPNRLHPWVLKHVEGRDVADTFPTHYRANTLSRIRRLAAQAGLDVESVRYLNNYPYLLMFSPLLCRLAIAYDEMIRRFACLHWLQGWILGVLRHARALPAPLKGAGP